MADLQHLLLTPGQEPEVRSAPLDYDAIVAAVGYPVEVIHLDGGRATMYVCEEGKRRGWPTNDYATRVAAPNLRNGDVIVGTALVVGPLGAGGVDTSLPDEVLTDLMEGLR